MNKQCPSLKATCINSTNFYQWYRYSGYVSIVATSVSIPLYTAFPDPTSSDLASADFNFQASRSHFLR